jgi:hypothetical protein
MLNEVDSWIFLSMYSSNRKDASIKKLTLEAYSIRGARDD